MQHHIHTWNKRKKKHKLKLYFKSNKVMYRMIGMQNKIKNTLMFDCLRNLCYYFIAPFAVSKTLLSFFLVQLLLHFRVVNGMFC